MSRILAAGAARMKLEAENYEARIAALEAQLAELAAENERLKKLLAGRDSFIVDKGLWGDFVASLPADYDQRILSALEPHPRATNTVDAHETASVSDKPEGKQGPVAWEDMTDAPKDGTMLRLLVRPGAAEGDGWTPFTDSSEPYATIGFNALSDTSEDNWQFAGWDWCHDCFTDGAGEVIGWLPFDTRPSEQAVTEAHKLLLWAADSFESHAKTADTPDEIDGYLGSAEMYREVASALKADYERRILSALVAHPRDTNTVDAHETANVSDKPEGQQEPVAWVIELSGNTGELIDRMAEAIRGDTTSDDTPWATLSEDRKVGWRGDAERALAVVKEYLTVHRPSEQAVSEAMVAKGVKQFVEDTGGFGEEDDPAVVRAILKAAMGVGG